MKVGFIVEHYPPTEGGVATSAQRVARELTKLGIDITVICFDSVRPLDSEEFIIEEIDNGVKVFRVGPFFLKQKLINVDSFPEKIKATFRRKAFNQMVSILQENKVDLIMSFYLLNAGYLALFVAREFQLPYVAGVRGNDIGRNIFNVERFSVVQWVVNGANHIVCVNEHLKRRMLLAFPDASNKTSVISNGVIAYNESISKENSRTRINQNTGWKNEDLIFVFTGTLREKKGVVPLVKALEICDNDSIKLLVVGPEIGSVEAKLCGPLWNKLKTDNVIYTTGHLPRNDVNNWMIGGDVVIMPSLDDGMANGLLEGMALGLCPVVSDVFTDVIQQEKNGLIVPANDAKSLAEVFNKLSKNRDLITTLGNNAQKSIEINHKPEIEAHKYLQLFKTILGNGENN
ncbi:MAG: glycosyltransferase family 4 protein [Bacteroidetes bacterium]|nr:glycosyltransferase family 4 protein [Bacteroidota bacterium]